MKILMSGNEAVARGAYEAGVRFGSAYPGTPSTEIFESLPDYRENLHVEWAPNEKVAAEAAYGASIVGVRSLCAMKHVGVNVAADPIFTAAYNGVGAGYVIISADDPSMHSSQNEQDNRNYARAAKLPMLEPANSQECKDFMAEAYKISEHFDTPLLYRLTTRVCHSKSVVELGEREEAEVKAYTRQVQKFIASPANAYRHHPEVEQRLRDMAAYGETSPLNRIEKGSGKIGVITAGVAYHYAREAFPEDTDFLKLGMTWPLPKQLIRDFAASVETLYIVEELDPFLETEIKAMGIACHGKEIIPMCYELNPEIIRESVFGIKAPTRTVEASVVGRPPALCPGCPHRGFFYTLSKRKDAVISGDIGCYTLGSADPLHAMDSVICMGASLSAGHGMSRAFELSGRDDTVVFGVIGDSTFFHSGITGAIEITYNGGKCIPCILDNSITSMTGQQDNPGTGKNLMGNAADKIEMSGLLKACGFEPVLEVDPQDLAAMKKTVDEAVKLSKEGKKPAIMTRRPCLLIKSIKHEKGLCEVDRDPCIACRKCIGVGCPAIFMKDGKSNIDPTLCVGCEVCLQVCPVGAIKKVGE